MMEKWQNRRIHRGCCWNGPQPSAQAATTPPRRDEDARIIVREEESWHTLLEEVDTHTAAVISEQPERFPGVRILQTTRRNYPHPDTAVHLTGARTLVRGSQASYGADSAEADSGGRVGRFGVEKSYDSLLAGVPGLRRITRDRRQRVIRTEVVREPVSGRDVLLTINWKLQLTAEQLLAEALGDAEPVLCAAARNQKLKANARRRPSRTIFPLVVQWL
ncbi:MAG UNVERIFIED_CONTAM: hypothetical protein LVR18_23355 [Planctomycetaceae bacterium]